MFLVVIHVLLALSCLFGTFFMILLFVYWLCVWRTNHCVSVFGKVSFSNCYRVWTCLLEKTKVWQVVFSSFWLPTSPVIPPHIDQLSSRCFLLQLVTFSSHHTCFQLQSSDPPDLGYWLASFTLALLSDRWRTVSYSHGWCWFESSGLRQFSWTLTDYCACLCQSVLTLDSAALL